MSKLDLSPQSVTAAEAGPAPGATLCVKFDTLAGFQQAELQALALADSEICMFDPNFALWQMNSPQLEQLLRSFLLGKRQARLLLAMHDPGHLQHKCPRFMKLLRDFSTSIECRVTPKHLRTLTDSFCVIDQIHQLRRFHCDHVRGEFAQYADCSINLGRFAQIRDESQQQIHATTLGL